MNVWIIVKRIEEGKFSGPIEVFDSKRKAKDFIWTRGDGSLVAVKREVK